MNNMFGKVLEWVDFVVQMSMASAVKIALGSTGKGTISETLS